MTDVRFVRRWGSFERFPALGRVEPGHLRHALRLAPWILRSKRNRLFREIDVDPRGSLLRWVAALAFSWVVLVSLTCGVVLSLMGTPTSSWALVGIGLIIATVPWSVGATSRTRALDLGQSDYAVHQAARSHSAVTLIVGDFLARAVLASMILLSAIVPGAAVILTSTFGFGRAALILAAVTLFVAASCLVALTGSLLRIEAGTRVVASGGYSVEIVTRAAVASLVAGTAAFVLGSLVTRVDPADYRDSFTTMVTPGYATLGAFLIGAAVIAAICATFAVRLINSRHLDTNFARLPSLVLHQSPVRAIALVQAWSGKDVIAAKEMSLVKRSRLKLQGGIDGLVSASSALVGIIVGASFSGVVPSDTARITGLLFAMAIVMEFISDGLKRINSADSDGAATTWVLISRRHHRQMILHRARRHARVLAFVVASVSAISVFGMSLSWVPSICIGVAGALMVLSGTVAIVGFSGRYPRWDWSSADEIGMHPSAQAFRHALNGVLWMTIFVLAALGSRAEASTPTSGVVFAPEVLLQLGAIVAMTLVGLVLAPRVSQATMGRNAAR